MQTDSGISSKGCPHVDIRRRSIIEGESRRKETTEEGMVMVQPRAETGNEEKRTVLCYHFQVESTEHAV